jgi:hypothetical protein
VFNTTSVRIGLSIGLLFSSAAFAGEQSSAPANDPAPLQVQNPHYVTISESIVINAQVDKVWFRVGTFCDIAEWMNSPQRDDCKYLQGNGGPGSVRSIDNEVLVGQTQYSYTYAQPPRKDTLYNLAHGTLAAEALNPATTFLTYTILSDDSILPDDASRQLEADSMRARVSDWLKNMKVLAEGGNLPPKPTGSLRPAITTPLLNPNPHYASLPMSIEVNAPVEKVWARIGKYCDIREWGFNGYVCELLSGKEGELGAVRTIGHSIIVGQARYSYTYTQPLRTGSLYPMYNCTVEARALGSNRTTLYYTVLWDDSVQPDDASRKRQVETYNVRFEKLLRNMKKLAERGSLTADDKQAPAS